MGLADRLESSSDLQYESSKLEKILAGSFHGFQIQSLFFNYQNRFRQ